MSSSLRCQFTATSILRVSTLEDKSVISREALEVGAFTWSRIQRLHNADSATHWQRSEAEGLGCPLEVFTQLFHEDTRNSDFKVIVRAVDWGRVRWDLEELSGTALRQFRIDRAYQHALDEARDRITQFSIVDDRQEVVSQWREVRSWFSPPIIVAGDLLGTTVGYALLVGFTRLGDLLGLLDRNEVSEAQKHLVWVGRGMERR